MDRYVIVDFKNNEIITANRIKFLDPTDGSSVACASPEDFANECAKVILEIMAKSNKTIDTNNKPC